LPPAYLLAGESLVHVAGVPFRFPPVCDGPANVRATLASCGRGW
jgi:hypothetical protein